MKWTAPILHMECESADKLRDSIIASLDDRLERYYGQTYGYSQGQYWPENYYFTWVSYILPQIIFQNPRVKIGSMRSSEVVSEVRALELAINRWIKDTNHRGVLRQLGFDLGFAYGVSFTSPVPVPGSGDKEDVPWRPQVTRINQRLYSIDPLADGPADARFQQHVSIDDRDALLERAKAEPEDEWNVEAIESAGGVEKGDLTKSKAHGVPDRGQIAYREIWCPGVQTELESNQNPEDYHGTVYTVALHPSSSKELEWLRKPRALMGPRWGPYTIFGAYMVPGCPYPLGPLVAVDSQLQELNALALANYKAGRRRKRIGLFDEQKKGLAQKIAKVEDGGTVGIPGFDKQHFAEAEFGGVTETGIMQEERARLMADRITGISDVQRGGTTGRPLATEILQAVGASNVRTADLAEQFTDAARRQLTTVAFYMHRYDKVSVPFTQEDKVSLVRSLGLPPDMAQAVMQAPMSWSGKNNKTPFDQLELEIEPYSMKRTDEPLMQQRALQAVELATTLGPAIVQNPHIRWKEILSKLGDAMNWPGFADILDEEVAAQMTTMMIQQQVQVSEPKERPQPRLAGDVSKPPSSSAMGYPKPSNGAAKSKPRAKVGAA